MRVVNLDAELLDVTEQPQKLIELAGRTCYKSETKITPESSSKFCSMIIKRGHESVLEHAKATVRVICDRGTSHQFVRHRLNSFSQESTRYVDYESKNIAFIKPLKIREDTDEFYTWEAAMRISESYYNDMRESNTLPEVSRSVLPQSLKTELVTTANFRQWRTLLKLRLDKHAQIEFQFLACKIYEMLYNVSSEVFKDLYVLYREAKERTEKWS